MPGPDDTAIRSDKVSAGLIPACIFLLGIFPVVSSAQVSIRTGIELFSQTHYGQAVDFFAGNSAAQKDNGKFHYYYGLSLYKIGKGKEAVEELEQANEDSAGDSDIYYALALANMAYAGEVNILKRVGLAKKMFHYLELSVEADPANLPAHTLYIFFLANAPGIMGGDLDKAKESAKTLYQVDKGSAAYAEAVIAAKEKREEEAVDYYRQALEQREYPAAEFALAGYLASLDRTGEALAHYETYVSMELSWYDPEIWQAYSAMADIYKERGEKQEARTYYEKALNSAPPEKERKTMQKALKKL